MGRCKNSGLLHFLSPFERYMPGNFPILLSGIVYLWGHHATHETHVPALVAHPKQPWAIQAHHSVSRQLILFQMIYGLCFKTYWLCLRAIRLRSDAVGVAQLSVHPFRSTVAAQHEQ